MSSLLHYGVMLGNFASCNSRGCYFDTAPSQTRVQSRTLKPLPTALALPQQHNVIHNTTNTVQMWLDGHGMLSKDLMWPWNSQLSAHGMQRNHEPSRGPSLHPNGPSGSIDIPIPGKPATEITDIPDQTQRRAMMTFLCINWCYLIICICLIP